MPNRVPEYVSDELLNKKAAPQQPVQKHEPDQPTDEEPAVPNAVPAFGPEQLLDEKQAAQLLDVTPQFLRTSRMRRPAWDGPPFVRVSKKVIRYRFGTLTDYIAARVVDPAEQLAKARAA